MTENSTVFVVDDDPGALESLRWMLEQADFRVKAFRSSQEFLDSYRPEETGCLVLDVRMPEMDGLALQADPPRAQDSLADHLHDGLWRRADVRRAFRGGAIDFLEKPVNDKVLLEHIERLIAQDEQRRGNSGGACFGDRLSLLTPTETRGPGGLDPGEEHQGNRPGEKGLRADHLAASDEHFSQDRRGKPNRVGPRRHPVAVSTATATAPAGDIRS